jgi:hypothetical protein
MARVGVQVTSFLIHVRLSTYVLMYACYACMCVCLFMNIKKGLAGIGIQFVVSSLSIDATEHPGFPSRIISLVQEGPAANSGLLSPGDEVVSCLCSPLAILLSLGVHYKHTHRRGTHA